MSAPRISPHGIWHVTTEGDVEGRTTRDLGIHEGYLDDIALALAGSAYYQLHFRPVDVRELSRRANLGTEVNVSLSIESGTWDMPAEERRDYFQQLLSGRDVTVDTSNYHAAVTLIRGANPARRAAARQAALRNSALSKLSPEEIAALGISREAKP